MGGFFVESFSVGCYNLVLPVDGVAMSLCLWPYEATIFDVMRKVIDPLFSRLFAGLSSFSLQFSSFHQCCLRCLAQCCFRAFVAMSWTQIKETPRLSFILFIRAQLLCQTKPFSIKQKGIYDLG